MQGKITPEYQVKSQLHQWHIGGSVLLMSREPDIDAAELLPWDQADRYALELAPAQGKILILGEKFGAISLGLGADRCVVWNDSYVSHQAIKHNWARQTKPTQGVLMGAVEETVGADYAALIVRVPRDFGSMDYLLDRVARHITEQTPVYFVGLQRHLPHSFFPWLQQHFATVQSHPGVKKAKAFTAFGYKVRKQIKEKFYNAHGIAIGSHPLVFGSSQLDPGSAFLLEHLKIGLAPKVIVDLGCGSGVLAAVAGKRYPEAKIIATDDSYAAVALAAKNLAANQLLQAEVILGNCGEAIPSDCADLLLLNPPFHRGTILTDALTRRMVTAAGRILQTGGTLYLVCNQGLSYEPLLKKTFGTVKKIAQEKRYKLLLAKK